jgi:hypothetical protein
MSSVDPRTRAGKVAAWLRDLPAHIRGLPGAWQRFWFAGVDARILGLMRILLGLIALSTHLTLYGELPFVLGPQAELFSSSSLHSWTNFSIYDQVESVEALRHLHTLFLIPLVMMILGVGGRLGCVGVLLWYMSLHHGNTWMLNAGDRLVRLSCFAMIFTAHTSAWSIDAWVMRKLGRPMRRMLPMTTHRLVQIQIAWMYIATGVAKWEGAHWHRGTALYYTMNTEVFQRFPGLLSYEFFASWPVYIILVIGTFVTLYWELLFPALVLWRPTRILALCIGVFVHTGIATTMMVASFSFASLWGYIAYLDADRLSRLFDRVERRLGLAPPEAEPAPEAVSTPPPDARSAAPA